MDEDLTITTKDTYSSLKAPQDSKNLTEKKTATKTSNMF
jgi:hypothetical protein